MQFFFFKNCTHILTRTQRKKFEDIFLVRIASKGNLLKRYGMLPLYSDMIFLSHLQNRSRKIVVFSKTLNLFFAIET